MRFVINGLKAIFNIINRTRLVIVNLIFFAILIGIIALFNHQPEKPKIEVGSLLQIKFNGFIVEQKSPVDISSELSKQMLDQQEQLQEYPVQELIDTIKYASFDHKISGLVLQLDGLRHASLNQIYDIGAALTAFKAEGKKVYAIADFYSQSQYLLASYADNISLSPQGMVMLKGFSVYRLYFKEALEKLLITPHIFKVGTYKSFVEPFTESEMSTQSKSANSHWLNQLWQGYISTVLAQRKDSKISVASISPTLQQLKENLTAANGSSALYASNMGLVDQLTPSHLALKAISSGQKVKLVSYNNYLCKK